MADHLVEQIAYLVKEMLDINCPVMSGNMQDTIEVKSVEHDKAKIVINAPTFDVGLWQSTGQIRYTHNGSYATSVNEFGGFHSNNKSKHWVNRAIYNACMIIANENDGEVILDVEL